MRGQTLRQELEQQGAFSEQKIWELLSDLLPVLQFVHQHQVIHRDIKPENVLRRQSDGKLVLIDFGVAKHLSATAVAKPGTSIGSFGYAPMEQIKGGEAYPASDLYSLGVACFHLLTGIHPSDLWTEQGYGWVMNWRQYLKKPISQELGQVLDKLLQKDIQQRYQSADQVLQDLNQKPQPPLFLTQPPILPKLGVTQPPPSAISHKPFPAPRAANPFKNRLLVGGVLLLLGLGGYGYWQSLGRILTLTGHSGEVNAVATSPDGQKIASGSDDQSIKIWNLSRGQELRTLTGHSNWVYSVAISPDGETLVSGSKDNTIKVWSLNTGRDLRTLTGHSSYVNAVAISPDGQKIATGSDDKTIKVWNLNTGEDLGTLRGHSGSVYAVAFSSDGQKLVSGSADKDIKIWRVPQ